MGDNLSWTLVCRDRASNVLQALGRQVRRTRDDIDDMDKHTKDADKSSNKWTETLGNVAGRLGSMARVGLQGVSVLASLASIVGPLAVGTVALVSATAQYVATVAPAAAAIAPLIAGLQILKFVISGFGKAFVQEMAPVKTAFDEANKSASDLATKGVRQLSAEFVKANFPAISNMMDRIGVATNKVVTSTIRWANSAEGVGHISNFTQQVATFAEEAAPYVSTLAIKFAQMTSRVSGIAFRETGDAIAYVADKLGKLIDGIDQNDVANAIDQIQRTAHGAAVGIRAIGDAAQWVNDHVEAIQRMSDAMGVLAIVGGVVAGGPAGWVAALGAAIGLLARHFDDAKAAVGRFKNWFIDLYNNTPGLQIALANVKDQVKNVKAAFSDAVDTIRPKVEPFLQSSLRLWRQLLPALSVIIPVIGHLMVANIEFAAKSIAAFLAFATMLNNALSSALRFVNNFVTGAMRHFASLLDVAARAARALGMDSLADRLSHTAAVVRAKAAEMQRAINGIQSKTVTVRTNFVVKYSATGDVSLRYGAANGTGTQRVNRARAGGGVADVGTYLVGEQGPELVFMDSPGYVANARDTARRLGGRSGGTGGGDLHVHLHVQSSVIGNERVLSDTLLGALRTAKDNGQLRAFGLSPS